MLERKLRRKLGKKNKQRAEEEEARKKAEEEKNCSGESQERS